MIVQKVMRTAVTAATVVAAVLVAIVAGAYAVFSLLQPVVGSAGASAIVAGAAALIAGVVALVVAGKGGDHHVHAHSSGHDAGPLDASLLERLMGLAKDKPVLAAAAGLAAGVFLLRNPVLFAALTKAFVDLKQPPRH